MEHATQGDLGTLIQRQASLNKPLAEADIMNWFVQILLALWHVHGKNVLHRDLKSQNIFMTEGSLVKLGDFGIARTLNSQSSLAHTAVGTPYYLSPEICEDKAYDHKSDVWSLGCILYEMATLKRAFNGQSLPALVLKILRGKYPPLPARYSGSMKGLVDCMLKIKPQMRPSVQELLCMPYVNQYIHKYAEHIMQLPDDTGHAPSLNLDQLPIIKQIRRSVQKPLQSAELEDLQAALNKQCFRRGRSAPEEAVASSSEPVSASRELDDDAEPRIAMVPISKLTSSVASQHNKELEKQQAAIQQERDRRKQHATQKALEVEEMQRAKSIVRCQSMERHKREVAEQDFEKASKAAAAEQARKDREQARLREQAEVQQRLVAHKQGVKAAKTRVDRAALQSLGEAFAARLQSNSGSADLQHDGRLDQQAGLSVLKSGAVEAFCSSGAAAGALGRDDVCNQAARGQDSDSVASSSDRREGQGPLLHRPQGSGPLLEVLTDIEDVLEGELTFRDGLPGSQEGVDKGSQEGGDRGGPTAGRVEQLRMSLEQQLGPSKLLAAHRYLTQVQNAQDDDANTQAVLEQILGNQMHLAHNINKLMSLESAVYQ
ncbi:hypothetical protein WJX82_010830 [Trebouxia sp. C0006]